MQTRSSHSRECRHHHGHRRRAVPPRPTLLVGDLEACHAAFDRLQQRVLELELRERAGIEVGSQLAAAGVTWQDLVARCRALRETLTSLHHLSHFTREVYEVAVDVCLRAADYPEALKCIAALHGVIFPALAARLLACHAAGSEGTGGGLGDEGDLPGADGWWRVVSEEPGGPAAGGAAGTARDAAARAALASPAFRRWPEVAAAAALYFQCAGPGRPAGGGSPHALDTLATLAQLPPALLASTEVQAAVRALAALAAGDYVGFFRVQARAPPLVRRLLQAQAGTVRRHALLTLAAAYRNVSCGAAARWLALGGGGGAGGGGTTTHALLAQVKELADGGCLPAQHAIDAAQAGDAAEPEELVFKW